MRTHRRGQQQRQGSSEVRAEKVEIERISRGAIAYHPSGLPTCSSDGFGRPVALPFFFSLFAPTAPRSTHDSIVVLLFLLIKNTT